MVSILILTFNEEANLGRCLGSVGWSDDVLIVDSFSTDRTVEIARERGARVLQNRFTDFAQQRNYGLEKGNLKHPWVLHLDADELVSAGMPEELVRVAMENEFPAYRVASKMMFEDRWLRFSGTFPAYQVRFGRCDRLRFKMVGHGQRETLPLKLVGTLKMALLHYSFRKGMVEWRTRHERYAAAEAMENLTGLEGGSVPWSGLLAPNVTQRRRALKALSIRMPCRPLLRFIYMYFLHLGLLDGIAGYRYCRLMASYERMIVEQLRDLRQKRRLAPASS